MTTSFELNIPERAPLFSRTGWLTLCAVVIGVFLVTLLGTQWAAPGSTLHISDYALTLVGKMLCYAIVAMSLNLVWGYCGILSLGHGLYFALGGYAMGMYLVQAPAPGQESAGLPAFTFLLNWTQLPWYWAGTQTLAWVLILAALVPAIVAFIFGYFAFRSRIKGVYLSIMTQAVTYAAMLLFFRNETGFGGNNGFTDFKSIAGYSISTTETRTVLFLISFAVLVLVFVLVQWIMKSRFGKVITAIRDSESRVMFIGFNPLQYKLAIWTLSALLCGIAGALYAPLVGIINPGEMSPVNSIEMVIWVAVGGRGSLIGSILGVFTVNGAKTFFTAFMPEYWLYVLGGLFVVVTLFMPKGLIGLFSRRRKQPLTSGSNAAPASEAV
ncbi:MAG: urea ABC transporter permease subunit UrtC [Advenella sp.]|uniref:Urea ABC transporter permease subunit UrtC n=1 Tax=Advenella kashmirensis TaxID=310575 RepID=A0A356LGH8_9BURK|nr:urea ABC transporter permease subunit UrtC [Advenella kashmirensis]